MGGQIARIPHNGCRLEIVATATTAHHGVSLLLPGQILRYKRSLFILDRLELPSGTEVGLGHFVDFKRKQTSRNLGVDPEPLFTLSGRHTWRNAGPVQQIAHEPVVIGPAVARVCRVAGTQLAAGRNDLDPAKSAEAHRSTYAIKLYAR
jgi:hypothetical protein